MALNDFLRDATERLAASSLEFEQTLATIAQLAVPSFAAGCGVHIARPDGTLAAVAVTWFEPAGLAQARELASLAEEYVGDATGPRSVMSLGRSDVVEHVAPSVFEDRRTPERVRELVEALDVSSYLCVPAPTESGPRAALTFVRTGGRSFEQDDIALAEELGRRAGQAIGKATTFERERSARERLSRLHALAAELAKSKLSTDEVVSTALEGGCVALGATSGSIYLPIRLEPGTVLRLARATAFGVEPALVGLNEDVPIDSARPAAVSFRRREAIWVETPEEFRERFPDFAQRWAPFRPDLFAFACVPLVAEDEAVGVLSFAFAAPLRFDEMDRAFIGVLAHHAAYALHRARFLERQQRQREHARVLADASKLLGATLDYETTLENVARIAMPTLGDLCFFDVHEEGGGGRRIAAVDGDPETCARLAATAPESDICATAGCRTHLHPTPDGARDAARALLPAALVEMLGLSSMIIAPLVLAGECLGRLTVCHGRSGRHHDESDVALVEELARRASVAVKHARVYRLAEETRRRAEEAACQAAEANRLKDDFLATVSHELRTPLSAILGWAALLRDQPDNASFLAKGLAVIERNARSQQRLVDDLLDVSRIVTGKLRLDTEPVDLPAVAADVLESVRPAAAAKRIELKVERIDGPCRIAGDSVRLHQVLWNLLSNAVKFTPEGGRVWIAIQQTGDRVSVRVGDTGKGIAPAFVPHVFERFRQADSSTTREHGGLGLGLAIVRHLTELHGGTVSADSDGVGRGSTFTVTLPVRPFSTALLPKRPLASAEAPAIAASSQPAQRLAGLRVLVVEDEPDSRDLIEILLRSEGAIVQVADSADSALAVVDAGADVVLSDIGMPGHDGYWLVSELHRRRPELPVIALTAYSGGDDVSRALAAGFDHHVAKPVDPDRLVRALDASRSSSVRAAATAS